MKKGDTVYYISGESISESKIQHVRKISVDGGEEFTEYQLLPYELGFQFTTEDKLFSSVEAAQEAHRKELSNQAKTVTLPVK